MWVGELEIRQDTVEGFRKGLRIPIQLESQQPSVKGEKNFDWISDVKVAKFSKFPRSCLKKKNDMKGYIKQSHILRLLPQTEEDFQSKHSMLLNLLSGKSCGYLEAVPLSDEMYRPLILMVTKDNQDKDILVGFCVDNPVGEESAQDKRTIINTFNRLFKENIKYSMVSTVVDQFWPGNMKAAKDPTQEEQKLEENSSGSQKETNGLNNIVELARSVISTKSPEDVKAIPREILTAFKGSLSNLKADIPLGQSVIETMEKDLTLKYKSHADWKINFYDKSLNYLALFVNNSYKDDEEYMIFCKDSMNLANVYDSEFQVSGISNNTGKVSHPQIAREICVRFIKNLSSFEQYFLKLGDFGEDVIIMETKYLEKLCEQFEIKHEATVMVINKLESSPPFIFLSITSNETIQRVERYDSQNEIESPSISFKRKHHNPDEIIEGKPKWSKIKVLRKSKIKKEENEKEKKVEEEILDFDRLNPHRSDVPEFDNNFDNTEERYQRLVLRMMADLQTETMVTLGDCRLDAEQDTKYSEEFLKWEKYKKDNKIYSSDFITKKKSKVDERLKVKVKNRIITKNPRKLPT